MAPRPSPAGAPGRIPSDSDPNDDDVPPQGAGGDSAFSATPGGEAARGRERAARTDGDRPARRASPGEALFRNDSDVTVKFTLRDEGNRPVKVECPPGELCSIPVEYADLMPRRAPQLAEVDRRARPRVIDE